MNEWKKIFLLLYSHRNTWCWRSAEEKLNFSSESCGERNRAKEREWNGITKEEWVSGKENWGLQVIKGDTEALFDNELWNYVDIDVNYNH